MKSLREQAMKISKALVFDINRFATHDGHGIRTTIFFKGCPLRCLWCQNPEGLSPQQRPIYLKKNCIHCGLCKKASKENQMTYDDRPYFNLEFQGSFDNLIKACPSSSIQYDSQAYTVEELVERVKQDEVFYKHGGGVTLSGGEPFMQGEFVIELLKRLKAEGIHTAIETSLYTSLALLKEALPYLDLIYADMKIYDEIKHKEYTGVSSQIIKKHIQYILESEYKDKVIIRTPLIPSISATDENITAISRFLVSIYPEVKYELLNYNPLASSKYELVDLEYGLDKHYKIFDNEKMNHFYNIVYQAKIKNLIKE